MSQDSHTACQTTWADFASELAAFAREAPFTFIGVSAVLTLLTVLASFFLWLMLPKASLSIAEAVKTVRTQDNGSQQELFDNDDAA